MKQYIFNNTTNYAEVEATIKAEYSNRIAASCSCGCHDDPKLCEIATLFTALEQDKINNQVRYKIDVRAIYRILNANCGC